jgi:hypothetical protein
MGDFEPIFIEKRDVEDFLQFFVIVITNIGICPLGF